jgi:enolase-phosphatase E1
VIVLNGIRAIVCDIEGTVGSISFVRDVLFPYARTHLPAYVRDHAQNVAGILNDVRTETGKNDLDTNGCIDVLLSWIDADKKITPLKTLQGLIWQRGFEDHAFTGHLFDDVAPQLRAWHADGLDLFIYSSGSVAAQKLYFGYSDAGDLTTLLKNYFDTTTGPKQDSASYEKIATAVGQPPAAILFLSDNPAELAAAKTAGWQVIGVNRPDQTFDLNTTQNVTTFADIKIEKTP